MSGIPTRFSRGGRLKDWRLSASTGKSYPAVRLLYMESGSPHSPCCTDPTNLSTTSGRGIRAGGRSTATLSMASAAMPGSDAVYVYYSPGELRSTGGITYHVTNYPHLYRHLPTLRSAAWSDFFTTMTFIMIFPWRCHAHGAAIPSMALSPATAESVGSDHCASGCSMMSSARGAPVGEPRMPGTLLLHRQDTSYAAADASARGQRHAH